MRDGEKVRWVGSDGPDKPGVGDTGTVLTASGSAGHVLWSTGALRGRTTLCEDLDVVPTRTVARTSVQAALEDSLEVGHHLAVRETFEESGETGLINAMAERGYLAGLTRIAEEAASLVAARLREEPAFARVLADLDASEGDALVTTASMVLLRDAFTPDEE